MVVAFQPVQLAIRFLISVILTSSNFESGQKLRKAICSVLAGVIMCSKVSREDYLQFALKKGRNLIACNLTDTSHCSW
jgi:hypothetical protein